MSTTLPGSEQSGTSPAEALSTLRVEVTFRDLAEPQAEAIAAELIGRVHELANTPEYECDVDVSVQTASPGDDGAHSSDAR